MSTSRSLGLLLAACALPLPAAAAQDRRAPVLPAPRPAAIEPLPAAEAEPEAGSATQLGGDPAWGGHGSSESLVSPVPPGFTDELVSDAWNQAVGVTFASDGRAYVWQRNGRVYVVEDGVKLSPPLLDVAQEVANWGDHGLIGFALDPDFTVNGHVYLHYAVDYHHLTQFGTPGYDPAANDYSHDTIGRITRYTATAESDFKLVDPDSRLVLLGESIGTGIPLSGSSHGVGSLVFGEDGTLLASCGDGNAGDGSNTLLVDGIIQPKENVSSFRPQLVDSLAGKLLRLDPATGDGLPSNPFFDPLAPRAPRSRVWALGLRNPARIALRPGSGQRSPSAGDPGTVCIGDVGAETSEELNVVPEGGSNLGWPLYEGLLPSELWTPLVTYNQDAPNPLYTPGHGGGCPQPYLAFQQLLLQASLNPPVWPNPCNPSVGIVTPAPLFVHQRPAVEWLHAGPARVPVFDGAGQADVAVLGTPESPVAGGNFQGNCSIGGAWSTSTGFPEPWQDGYFHGDYGVGWIRFARFDAGDALLSIEPFADPVGRIVSLAWDESSGSLWYLDYTDTGIGELRRIRWAVGNQPPVAWALPHVSFLPAPATVDFDGSLSSDPEGEALRYSWDFGDGTPPSLLPNPVHVFPSEDITALGTIIGKVFELTPPGSTSTFSSDDPEVMRDGDYPPEGSAEEQRQYDTIHVVGGASDKDGECWMGYAFPGERRFLGLLYQEGLTYGGGGWFDTWDIEVRQEGEWLPVWGVGSYPPYPPGDGAPHYQTFEFRFPPAAGDAIRIHGAPGGLGNLAFITIGELRVLAEPLAPLTGPASFSVTLTVADDAGAEDQAVATVSLNNTPPVPVIVTPANFGAYPGELSPVELSQASFDAEQGGELSCAWQVILHHNTHSHPGPLLEECAPPLQPVLPEGCGDGSIYFNEIRLTVTDPLGLSATTSHFMVPACDRNLNGADDELDIAEGGSLDLDRDGVPDEVQADCDADGQPDFYVLYFGLASDVDGDGLPDDCEGPDSALLLRGAPGPIKPPPFQPVRRRARGHDRLRRGAVLRAAAAEPRRACWTAPSRVRRPELATRVRPPDSACRAAARRQRERPAGAAHAGRQSAARRPRRTG
ncbi:MAG TPA: PQQ-dependent sugar dehydrogenase [Planctomycetota bacterium]|nr:PQQ-dependent sugar dehydrogenase [Planctomycetota bacterium]